MNKLNIDEWVFSGAGAFVKNIDNAAAVDASDSYPDLTLKYGGVVTIPVTGHGYLASPNIFGPSKNFLLGYITGTDNYDGLRVIVAVATDTITILSKYVAETFAGSGAETIQPGFKFDHDIEILGFDLHLSAASATVEDLTIIKDSDLSTAFDNTIYTLAMNTVQNASINFEELSATQREVRSEDRIYFNWANTNGRTWGLTIRTCRRA